nr:YggT family protein [Treponema sp.]
GLAGSRFAYYMSRICDPYLNLFRRFSFLRLGSLDFSPAVAICVLSALATILANISATSHITIGGILSMIISLTWSVVSSIIFFLILLIAIRLVVILITNDYGSTNSIWGQLDRILSSLIYTLTGIFSKNTLPYKKALILSAVTLVAFYIIGKILIGIVCTLLMALPV